MIAPMLSPNPPNTRISQVLPTVKCSNCNQPVPLSELGDHTCAKPPPVPTLPKPAASPAAVTALLPQHLQDRVSSPGPAKPSTPAPAPAPALPAPNPAHILRPGSSPPRTQGQPPQPPPQQQRSNTPQNDRLRINTATPSAYQQRSSPLARPDIDRSTTASPASIRPPPQRGNTDSLYSRPPPPPSDPRARAMSNAPSPSNSPVILGGGAARRPSFSSIREPAPPPPSAPLPPTPLPPQPPMSPHPPYISEADIDTKSGGEAGMAGVGRRGFAAAARAAMFVMPQAQAQGQGQSQIPPPRRPGYLGIHVPPRSNGTPPLSAGSGYSSHSPGVSPYPQSPASPHAPHSPPRRTPSAASQQPPRQGSPKVENPQVAPVSPVSPVRMPFFEKFKNQLPNVTLPTPGLTPNTDTSNDNNNNNNNTPSTAIPPPGARRTSDASTSSAYSQMIPGRSVRSLSINSAVSGDSEPLYPPHSPTSVSEHTPLPAVSHARSPSPDSDSGSECGLAYADSTDYENEQEDDVKSLKSIPGAQVQTIGLTSSILRSGSIASTNHVRFPSVSDQSSRSGRSAIVIRESRTGHRRDASVSSVESTSSAGSASGRDRNGLGRSNSASAQIAHALGLSQTSPSAYDKLGGPGVGGRSVRSASGSSSGSRSGYSRGGNSASKTGKMEREMETLLEDAALGGERRVTLLKSHSTGTKRSFETEGADATIKTAGIPGAKAHRSNTVPGPAGSGSNPYSSPEAKAVKLPARARTSTEREKDREVERKVRVRVCLKCEKRIEDGRWVKADGAGALCEKCWKNMYLPKCRRCTLPIEKQAVSSSDGQLKGKYHRECFNCHTCHKPFPDKTFYVFDGKPLCAYHYHEANDSLCAAARCGQPIEGPCAVSHTGDRYHPEHMTCEWPGSGGCGVRLAEYWEVDGRMLCERHAMGRGGSEEGGDGEEDGEGGGRREKAMKRVTRFIDLAGKDGLGGSDLR